MPTFAATLNGRVIQAGPDLSAWAAWASIRGSNPRLGFLDAENSGRGQGSGTGAVTQPGVADGGHDRRPHVIGGKKLASYGTGGLRSILTRSGTVSAARERPGKPAFTRPGKCCYLGVGGVGKGALCKIYV